MTENNTTVVAYDEVETVEEPIGEATTPIAVATPAFDAPQINLEDKKALDQKIAEIKAFLVEHKGAMSESTPEKDRLYEKSLEMWNDFAKTLRESRYTFTVNEDEYKYLFDLVTAKIEYDVNNLFIGLKVKDTLFPNKLKQTKGKNITIHFTPDSMALLYHLIAQHKITGLTRAAYNFAAIIRNIGEISKIFNEYDVTSKHLNQDINNWVADITTEDESAEPAVLIEPVAEETPKHKTKKVKE